jgi:hypothetical protein
MERHLAPDPYDNETEETDQKMVNVVDAPKRLGQAKQT